MDSLAEALGRWLAKLLRLERVVTIAGALLLTVIAYRALSHLIDRVLRPPEGAADYSQKAQRARTLGPLLKSAALYLLAFLALVVVLRREHSRNRGGDRVARDAAQDAQRGAPRGPER